MHPHWPAPRVRLRNHSRVRPLSFIFAFIGFATASLAEDRAHVLPAPLLRWLEPAWGLADARFQSNAAALARLPVTPHTQPTARLGYHSFFAPQPNVAKWLQVDLGAPTAFDSVVLVAAEAAEDASPGPGYGFPLRFRVEAADDEHFAEPRLLADHTEADFPNPGNLPVFISAPGSHARYVRITATRLRPRGGRCFFALGEMMILRGQHNIAVGCPVRAIDSYPASLAWHTQNVTDGCSALGPPVENSPSPSNGWHSEMSNTPDAVQWVQVTLSEAVPVTEVRLYPASPTDYPMRSGFGFPLRFRVEGSAHADFSEPVLLHDATDQDFVNPGENPVSIFTAGQRLQAIRVTATRLWERNLDFAFALAELEVWSGDRNVARGAPVSSSGDTLRPKWQPVGLTDGATSRWFIAGWPEWLRGLSERRELELQQSQLTAELEALNRSAVRLAVRWLVVAALALGVLIGLWLWRGRRQRQLATERLRERIAADLHDEIGSQLASIALLSQVGAQRGEATGQGAVLTEIHDIARETSAAMRDIVWLVRPSPASVDDLLLRFREVATRLLGQIEWELRTEALPASLPLEVRRHLYLFTREALRNAAIHAHARRVDIRFFSEADRLVLTISDDGVGFLSEALTTGTGLVSLRSRAAALGGTLKIDSAPAQGTRLVLTMPLKS